MIFSSVGKGSQILVEQKPHQLKFSYTSSIYKKTLVLNTTRDDVEWITVKVMNEILESLMLQEIVLSKASDGVISITDGRINCLIVEDNESVSNRKFELGVGRPVLLPDKHELQTVTKLGCIMLNIYKGFAYATTGNIHVVINKEFGYEMAISSDVMTDLAKSNLEGFMYDDYRLFKLDGQTELIYLTLKSTLTDFKAQMDKATVLKEFKCNFSNLGLFIKSLGLGVKDMTESEFLLCPAQSVAIISTKYIPKATISVTTDYVANDDKEKELVIKLDYEIISKVISILPYELDVVVYKNSIAFKSFAITVIIPRYK